MTGTSPVLGMILKGFPRISETFISNEILGLEKRGFRIHIFSMRKPRESFAHKSVHRIAAPVDYLPETLLSQLPRLLPANARAAAARPAAYGRALGMAVRRFSRSRKSATLKHLLQAGYLVDRFLPNSGVTHFHAHFAHSPTSVALFAATLSGLAFSFTAHAKDIYTANPDQIREKMALSRFVVTCTEYNRRHLLALTGGAGPVHRVYHGIDLSLFNGNTTRRRPEPPYRVLTIARLTRKKGLSTVLEAVAALKNRGMALRHTLIGDGEDRDAVQAAIRRLGLSRTCRWIGTQPHHVVLDHYRRADLFVLGCEIAPNGDRDGIPNVLVESMAMGVPVVATRVSAIPEIVMDGRTGLLVPPSSPGAMADAMQRLLTDTDLRDRMAAAARERVAAHFDNDPLTDELARLFAAHGAGSRRRGTAAGKDAADDPVSI